MTQAAVLAYQNHLRHATALPFAWAPRERVENPLAVARRQRRNIGALAMDSAGDERRTERAADETGAGIELQRIETKLNAVIELFATLLERDLELPAITPIRFNAHGVEWQTRDPLPAEQPLLVRIHLEACPALPIELAAIPVPALEPGWAAAVFSDLRAPMPELLERLVFREHRRQLADSIETKK
jgi:hypothetical protein